MKFFYYKICNFYNFFFSIYQNFFLKGRSSINLKSSEFNKKGYELFFFKNHINSYYKVKKNIKVSKYIHKDIIFENSIMEIVDYVFVKNQFAKKVSEITGFCYSIDFIVGYETFSIPVKDNKKDWYANKWHNDKPFTQNTLKFIIPLNLKNTISQSGGIEILDLKQSQNYVNNNKIPDKQFIFFMKNLNNELLIFNPNLCYHRAGNPLQNKSRKQIMFQLNPSKKWCINSKIFEKQFKIEPKFPSFNYLWDKRIKLKI